MLITKMRRVAVLMVLVRRTPILPVLLTSVTFFAPFNSSSCINTIIGLTFSG